MAMYIFDVIYMLLFADPCLFFSAVYNDFAWLRSFLLLFTMLLHTIPVLVLAAIYNDLCMNCSCNFQCVLHTRVSCCCYLQLFLHGCITVCCYLQCVCTSASAFSYYLL
jgi:hypothetical protein